MGTRPLGTRTPSGEESGGQEPPAVMVSPGYREGLAGGLGLDDNNIQHI